MNPVKNIYDRLFEFEKDKKDGEIYPIHKPLNFGNKEKDSGIQDITDIIIQLLPKGKKLRVLDAGCGVGYSLLKLAENPEITGLGISLSEKELAMARETAESRNLSSRCTFRRQSFDEDLGETFDLIFCLESLKHSPDWKNTLAHFQKHLTPDGQLIVVEDFFTQKFKTSLVEEFQKSWSVPDMFREVEMFTQLKALNFSPIHHQVLDEFVIRKNALVCWITHKLLKGLLFCLRNGSRKTLLEIYQGVVLMDYFYAKNSLSYQLLHFQQQKQAAET